MCQAKPGKRCISHVTAALEAARANVEELMAAKTAAGSRWNSADEARLSQAVTRVENLHWDADCTRSGTKRLLSVINKARSSAADKAEARRRLDRAKMMNVARDAALANMPSESVMRTAEDRAARAKLADQWDEQIYLIRRQQEINDHGTEEQARLAQQAIDHHTAEINATYATHGWPKPDKNRPGDTRTPYAMCRKCGQFGGSAHRCPLNVPPAVAARTPDGWAKATIEQRSNVTMAMALHGYSQCDTCGQFTGAAGHSCPGTRVMDPYDWQDHFDSADLDTASEESADAAGWDVTDPPADPATDQPSPVGPDAGADRAPRQIAYDTSTEIPDARVRAKHNTLMVASHEAVQDLNAATTRVQHNNALKRLAQLKSLDPACLSTVTTDAVSPPIRQHIDQIIAHHKCSDCGQFAATGHDCPADDPSIDTAEHALHEAFPHGMDDSVDTANWAATITASRTVEMHKYINQISGESSRLALSYEQVGRAAEEVAVRYDALARATSDADREQARDALAQAYQASPHSLASIDARADKQIAEHIAKNRCSFCGQYQSVSVEHTCPVPMAAALDVKHEAANAILDAEFALDRANDAAEAVPGTETGHAAAEAKAAYDRAGEHYGIADQYYQHVSERAAYVAVFDDEDVDVTGQVPPEIAAEFATATSIAEGVI